ncbi:hypothetical protein JFMEOBDD_00976 [Streptococcus equi subsp. zooepidemicus]|nr:hypothetical protein JFMEOBDD_00976 [Streptococcus equi subsp. zooepidemicus]
MRTYENKEELKTEINKTFKKYISEFDNIPETLKDKRVDEVDRTPAENLAYQVGWTTLLLKWEKDERKGLKVKNHRTNLNGINLVNYISGLRILTLIYPYKS